MNGPAEAGAPPETAAPAAARRPAAGRPAAGPRGWARAAGPLLGLAAVLVVAYLLMSGTYLSNVFEDVLVYAIAAMGLDFLGGYGGLISLSQAGFLGLGAYGVAIAEAHGLSPWLAVAVAAAVVLAAAAVTGIAAIRVTGLTFVIITLAIGQILWGLSYQWTSLTEGDNGLPLGAYPSIGPLSLSDPQTLRLVTLAVFLVVLFLLLVMTRSPFGLSLQGLKSNERRLRALGYRTGVQRYLGFVVSALCAGVAGVLYLYANSLISPTTLEFPQDGILVLMVILGGLRSIWGPCLGAIVIVLFQQEVSIYMSRWQTLMGLVFILAVIFTPDGIAGLLRAGLRLIGRTRPTADPSAIAAGPPPAVSGAASGQAPPGQSSPGQDLPGGKEAG